MFYVKEQKVIDVLLYELDEFCYFLLEIAVLAPSVDVVGMTYDCRLRCS